MRRAPFDLIRMFVNLFPDLPPLSRTLYLPGAILLLGYPMLTVLLGSDLEGQAFVTAFLAALAVRIAMDFEGMVRRMLTRCSVAQTALFALSLAVLPLLILSFAEDPVWCQRMQSLFYLVIGAIFLSDVLKGRDVTAASFWPDAEMQPHLSNLSRMMVVYNFSFLVLNETMIQTVSASNWLLFWSVLPILGHSVLRAMVLTVINFEDDGHAV